MHGADLPNWVLKAVLVALVLGFPLAVVLAWVYDLTAQGVKRTPSSTDPGAPRFGRSRLLLPLAVSAVVLAIAAAGAGGWYAWKRAADASGPRRRPDASPSIAVLPFKDLSPDHDQEYFSDGMAEEILTALSKVKGLRVPGRASSFYFKGKDVEPGEIARKLGVAHLLEGSVRRSGNKVRISAEVVRASDGDRLWSQTFDRDLTDVFAIQDEISRDVVEALRVKLMPGQAPRRGSTARPARRPTRATSSARTSPRASRGTRRSAPSRRWRGRSRSIRDSHPPGPGSPGPGSSPAPSPSSPGPTPGGMRSSPRIARSSWPRTFRRRSPHAPTPGSPNGTGPGPRPTSIGCGSAGPTTPRPSGRWRDTPSGWGGSRKPSTCLDAIVDKEPARRRGVEQPRRQPVVGRPVRGGGPGLRAGPGGRSQERLRRRELGKGPRGGGPSRRGARHVREGQSRGHGPPGVQGPRTPGPRERCPGPGGARRDARQSPGRLDLPHLQDLRLPRREGPGVRVARAGPRGTRAQPERPDGGSLLQAPPDRPSLGGQPPGDELPCR